MVRVKVVIYFCVVRVRLLAKRGRITRLPRCHVTTCHCITSSKTIWGLFASILDKKSGKGSGRECPTAPRTLT